MARLNLIVGSSVDRRLATFRLRSFARVLLGVISSTDQAESTQHLGPVHVWQGTEPAMQVRLLQVL